MRRIGNLGRNGVYSFNTCQHKNRLFNFSLDEENLAITEIFLGSWAESSPIPSTVKLSCGRTTHLACCSLGPNILLMGGDGGTVSAALVSVEEERGRLQPIQGTPLTVVGISEWMDYPFLFRLTKNQVILYFGGHNGIWYCEVNNSTLVTTLSTAGAHVLEGFSTLPTRLLNGKLFVAGSYMCIIDATGFYTTKTFSLESVGNVPGDIRTLTSTVLVKDRFVVGFGGYHGEKLQDLWIFDSLSYKASKIRQQDDWHTKSWLVVLVVQDDTLYLVGGMDDANIYAIPLAVLTNLIVDWGIRAAFRQALAPPPEPRPGEPEALRPGPPNESVVARLHALNTEIVQLRRDLQEAQGRNLTIPVLEAEIESLREKNRELQDDNDRILKRSDALLVRFPVFPACELKHMLKGQIDASDLENLLGTTRTQEKELIRRPALLREYRVAFNPLLDPDLPRTALLASAEVSGAALHATLRSQVMPGLAMDKLLSRGHVPPAARLPIPRRVEKLLDSPALHTAAQATYRTASLGGALAARVPPLASRLSCLLESSDPLGVSAVHASSVRARRATRVSRGFYSLERVRGIREAVERLSWAYEISQRELAGVRWDGKAAEEEEEGEEEGGEERGTPAVFAERAGSASSRSTESSESSECLPPLALPGSTGALIVGASVTPPAPPPQGSLGGPDLTWGVLGAPAAGQTSPRAMSSSSSSDSL